MGLSGLGEDVFCVDLEIIRSNILPIKIAMIVPTITVE